MGRKPQGDKPLTNAERQKRYRDRHKLPKVKRDRPQQLIHEVALALDRFALVMTPDDFDAALKELATWLDHERVLAWRRTAKGIEAEKARQERAKVSLDPSEKGKIIAKLQRALNGE